MDYANGKIYTIRSYQTDDIYIGSTTQTLTKRLSSHKMKFKNWENGKNRRTSSFEIIKYDDAYIELLELFPCSSKLELHRREGQLIREMDCVNKRVEGRTKKEYCEENKDKIKMKNQKYREANKDKIKMTNQKYREENRDKMREARKKYYEANKDKLRHKYICECGGKFIHKHKSTHLKSQKHKKYIQLTKI